MVRFTERRTGIVEQRDTTVLLALFSRQRERLSDLHLRADVRADGACGLAFRASPDGRSYYAFAVVMPGTPAYRKWFPPEVQAATLSANYNPEDTRTIAVGYPMAVLARIDGGKVHVLRGMRLSGVKRGAWVQLQVKARGDLLQGAANGEIGLPEATGLEANTNRDTCPTYVGARDTAYTAGGVGLVTDRSTGAFRDLTVWSSPQMMRDLWTYTTALLPEAPAPGAAEATDSLWKHAYEADVIPPAADPAWEDLYLGQNIGSADGGILTLRSTLQQQEHYRLPHGPAWSAGAKVGTTVECRVRVVSGVEPDKPAALLSFSNGAYAITVCFFTDRVAMGPPVKMATTDGFHTYRITLDGSQARLYVDGKPTAAASTTASPAKANEIYFGDASNTYVGGETRWDYIRWTNAGAYPPVPGQ